MFGSVSHHLRRNLVAYLALLFALTGTSYAAATTLLPANSVGTRQVINHSLLKKDFKRGQLPRGRTGPQGLIGPPGPTGPQGIVGVGRVELTYADVDPASLSEVKAFVATGSSSPNCLATLSESNFAVDGTTLYCGARVHDGANGIWVHILLPVDFAPTELLMWVTVYQEGAQQYAAPVFCLCP
jgi:hypothetical protein